MACSRSAREARPDSASTPTDWGCGSSTDEAALVASCGQVGGAAVPACASHVERQCKRACAVMPVRVDMWAWALRMHARTDAHARRCTPAPAAQVHTTTADIRRCIVASDTPLRRRCAQGWRAWCSRGDSKTFATVALSASKPEESRMCQLYRWEKMLVVKTLRPLQQPRKATKEVLGLSWQCGSSTPVITSGKRSAGARCVSSDVPWRSLAKIDGRRCRQGGDVGLASREPRAVHREAGHTQPGVAAVRVVRSVEPASAQTCATSA